jgi:hypothetical protein
MIRGAALYISVELLVHVSVVSLSLDVFDKDNETKHISALSCTINEKLTMFLV